MPLYITNCFASVEPSGKKRLCPGRRAPDPGFAGASKERGLAERPCEQLGAMVICLARVTPEISTNPGMVIHSARKTRKDFRQCRPLTCVALKGRDDV